MYIYIYIYIYVWFVKRKDMNMYIDMLVYEDAYLMDTENS